MGVCICMCISISMHKSIQTCIYAERKIELETLGAQISTYIDMYSRAYVCIHAYPCLLTYINTYIYRYIHTYIHALTHITNNIQVGTQTK